VDGLGLILGHGMSRFDFHPAHPNAPGPGKRPLNNMCPTVVLRDSTPFLALGAAGARTIVNIRRLCRVTPMTDRDRRM
jgi:gamma-glutamyltranspeptidase/glutathione hydrolase